MDNTTIQLPAIDAEHDIRPVVVIVPDYNGEPIAHVFVTGERVLRMEPLNDWSYEFTPCTTTMERQAHAALAYHLGGITEDQDQRLADVWGMPAETAVFDDVMSQPTDECHALVAWAGTVAQAVYVQYIEPEWGRYEPTGW